MNDPLDKDQHRKTAVTLFNHTWDLLEKQERTQEETDEMIHAAHASRYHWGLAGTALNFARGEWQISRVYAVLNRAEPALFHAKRCLHLCLEHGFGDFDLAFAYEAMARSYAVQGEEVLANDFIEKGKQQALVIEKAEEREHFLQDLATITF